MHISVIMYVEKCLTFNYLIDNQQKYQYGLGQTLAPLDLGLS